MGRERERKRTNAGTKTFGVSNVLHLWKCTCRSIGTEPALKAISTLQLEVIKAVIFAEK